MSWKVETVQKKSITERTGWYHREYHLFVWQETIWRWGNVIVSQDPTSDTDVHSNVEFSATIYDVESSNLDDKCNEDWVFPDSMSEEDQESFLEVWDTEKDRGLNDDGWEIDDVEIIMTGPLLITKENKIYD